MNYKILSSSLSILLIIFFIAQNSLDYNPIKFHCDNYILNSYLYLFLSLSIVFSTIFSMEHINVDIEKIFAGNSRFLLLILSIGLILALTIMTPKYFFTKHILWLLWTILITVFIYPIYKYRKDIFYHAGISTLLILVVLSALAFMKPNLIKESWGFNLFMMLIGLLISMITEQLLRNWGIIHDKQYSKVISYIAIAVFSLFILYDTKKIIVNANNCVNPDYINQSLDLFLDIMNIFTNLANIKE